MSVLFQPIWPALFMGVVLLVAIIVAYENWGWWEDPVLGGPISEGLVGLLLGGMMLVLFIMLAAAIGHGVGYAIGELSTQVWSQNCWRARVATIRSADGVQGHIRGGMFILVGRIESRAVYYFYTIEGDGQYKPHRWFPDGDTHIFEEDRNDGEVVQCASEFAARNARWVAIPSGRVRMEFHVPKGTVATEFSLQ